MTYTREELNHRYKEFGMCKSCGVRPHMRVFVVCRPCRTDSYERKTDKMTERVHYSLGRTTFKGVEVCEYQHRGNPTEQIRVVAYAASNVLAEYISQALNQRFATGGSLDSGPLLP